MLLHGNFDLKHLKFPPQNEKTGESSDNNILILATMRAMYIHSLAPSIYSIAYLH